MNSSTYPSASPRPWLIPVLCAVLCLILGTGSGLLTVGSIGSWYAPLEKPPGTPPSWVFGPVWTTLYLLMGFGLGRLIVRKKTVAVRAFLAHFVLNLAWTPVFFGAHLPWVALAVILAMIVLLVLTLRFAGNGSNSDPVAVWMIAPTLVWVCYATWLNAGIAWLNR